jgi:hypothetical protein
LSEFIESFGFQPMLSELSSSFPVDPDATAIENCIANVRRHADLFVLIVGKRSGTPDATGKSVTNLEYLAARAEGVPVFVFISSEVIAQMPVWKANREKRLEFPGVDSERLFEFVELLRGQSERWCFTFESAQQIQQVLRDQWSSLIASMLDTRRRTRGRNIPRIFAHLSADAQQLILERPGHWEYSLFAQILLDGIANLRFRRRDFDLGLSFRTGRNVPNSELFSWTRTQMAVATQIPVRFNRLFSGPVMESFGPPGVAGDPEAIVHVAERTVTVYEKALEWAEDLRAAVVHERVRTYVETMAQLVGRMLDEFEEFAEKCHTTLEALKRNPPKEGEKREIALTLTLSVDPKATEALEREMHSLQQAIERGEFSLNGG